MAIKETVPFNFDEVYSYIENKFKERGYDTQEGSNTMQLVTAMSYLTSMLNVNTAVNINETLLPQARKRNMILQDARTLGYEIEHRQSYKYDIALNFTEVGTTTIQKYDSFTAGDKTYYYLLSDSIKVDVGEGDINTIKYYSPDMPISSAFEINGSWDDQLNWAVFSDESFETAVVDAGFSFKSYTGKVVKIPVTEGTLHKYVDNPSLSILIGQDDIKTYVDIPFTNVEENGIDVFLTYIESNGAEHKDEEWTRSKSFMLDNDNLLSKQFIRLDNIEFGTPRIYFKFGEVGAELLENTFVRINVLESSGVDGKIESGTPVVPDTIQCDVIEVGILVQGAEEETDESIKANAPLFNNTANRIITKSDYSAFANRQADVKTSVIWDGNEEFPKRPGHIWFSFLPSNNERVLTNDINANEYLLNTNDLNNWYMSETGVDNVFLELENYKIPTLEFHHRHPMYMDFEFNINVIKYLAATTKEVQNKNIFDIIDQYFVELDGVENFNFEYLNSNLIRRIDRGITDSTGINIELKTSVPINKNSKINEEFDPCALPQQNGKIAAFDEFTTFSAPSGLTAVGYGRSVSQYNGYLAVGSIVDSLISGSNTEETNGGEVYLYNRTASGYDYIDTIANPETNANDFFGAAVALNGNRLIIGAPLHDTEAENNAGRVYIYDMDDLTTPYQTITESNSLWFGSSVALDADGDRLLVGEVLHTNGLSMSGIVHVYSWNGTAYVKTGTVAAADEVAGEGFGSGVACWDGRLVVGAQSNSEAGTNAGKVYIYKWNGTAYEYTASIIASDAQPNSLFGFSVEAYENKVLVGAIADNSAGVDAGRVYVYELNSNVWSSSGTITASDARSEAYFGIDISLRDGRLIIGSTPSEEAIVRDGKVYAYDSTEAEIDYVPAPGDDFIIVYKPDTGVSKLGTFTQVMASNEQGTIAIENPTENKIYLYRWDGNKYIEFQQITL